MSGLCFGCQYKVHSLPDTVLLRHMGKHISSLAGCLLDDSNQGIKGRHTEGKEPYMYVPFSVPVRVSLTMVLYPGKSYSIFLVYCSCFLSLLSLSLLYQK